MSRKDREQRKQKRIQKEQQKARRQELVHRLKPLLLTFVVWFALKSVIHIPSIGSVVEPFFVSFTTNTSYWFGRLLFIPIQMHGVPYLSVNNFFMEVIMECTAYNFYLFVIVLTIFSRWPLRHKFTSLGIFLATIFVINSFRFITMGYVGSFRPDLFDVVHDYVWNILFGFLVFGIWIWREETATRQIKSRAAISVEKQEQQNLSKK